MISVVASLKIKDGHQADFEAAAKKLMEAVAANEPDCHYYHFHRSDDPCVYVAVERYENMAAVENHGQSAHFKELGAALGPHMDGRPDIMRLEEI